MRDSAYVCFVKDRIIPASNAHVEALGFDVSDVGHEPSVEGFAEVHAAEPEDDLGRARKDVGKLYVAVAPAGSCFSLLL